MPTESSPLDHPSASDLVGRDTELREIDRFLGLAAAGTAVLTIVGEAGIGKTALWARALDKAAQQGWHVLRAAPAEAEQGDAYAGLSDLFRPVVGEIVDVLPAPLATALQTALLLSVGPIEGQPAVIGVAAAAGLNALAARRPLVVAIDDVQWLDADSARAIAFAAARTEPAVSFAIALRGDDASSVPLGLDRAIDPDRQVLIRPAPLSLAGVHHLISPILGPEPPRAVLTRITRTSGGNPFVALELARAWSSQPEMAEDQALPERVRRLIEDRLGRLSPGARELVLYVAAAGRPTIPTLVQLIGARADLLLDEAEAAGVLRERDGRVVVTHPLLAAGAYGAATPAARRRIHARLADVASDIVERGRHLAVAATAPDGTAALEISAAARLAMERGAAAAAADLFAAAIRFVAPEPDVVAALLAREAVARVAVGEVPEARDRAERALAAAPTEASRLAVLLETADIAWADGSVEREWHRLRAVGPELRPDVATEIKLRTQLVALGVAIAPREAVAQADAALELVDASADPRRAAYLMIHREMASALAGLGINWDALAEGVELEERNLASGGGISSPPLVLYTMTDRIDEMRRRYTVEEAWYTAHGEEGWLAERQGQRALAEVRAGEAELATSLADGAAESLDEIGASRGWPLVFAWRSLVDAHLGRLERARTTIDRTVAEQASVGRLWLAILESVSAFVAFAAGDHEAALAAVARMRAAMAAIGVRDLLADRSESFTIELHLARGEADTAIRELDRLEERHDTLPRAWTSVAVARGRALLRAADGDLAGALDLLDAIGPDELSQPPFEKGWTLLARGRLLRRMREKKLAAATLREARDLFVNVGGKPWAVRAEQELERVGLRRRDPSELSAAELEVAKLAGRGLSNREVAEAAFISPKTVEANLARIYRKLDIRSRAELGAWLREQEQAAPPQM